MNNKERLSHEAEEQSSRIYFCQVKAPTFSAAKKVVVTKTWNDLKPPKTTSKTSTTTRKQSKTI